MKNKKYLFIVIGAVILLVLFLILYLNPIIMLKGKKEITLPLNDNYSESGYIFIGFNKNKLKVEEEIDVKKTGDYEIIYKYGNKKVKRKIKVVDNIKPEIKLKGDNPAFVCNYELYKEEGYEVSDNYDITEDIKINIKQIYNKII